MSNRPAPTSPEAGRVPATVRKPLRPRATGRVIVRALNSLRSRAFRLITRAAHQARTVGVLFPVLSLGHERDGTIRERRSLSERGDPLLSGAAILADVTGQFHPGMTQDPDSWIAAVKQSQETGKRS